jgi:8-oxo-dGTP diphosphatase
MTTEWSAVQAILATLGYVLSDDERRVLLIHRDARSDDLHYGRYNGLGGKLEPDEDICAGMRREISEEAGLSCERLDLAGTISWPGFGHGGENWFGFIFRIPSWSGTPYARNHEGTLVWVEVADLLAGKLHLWEGDAYFLPMVFGSARQFHAVLPYTDGKPTRWSCTEL